MTTRTSTWQSRPPSSETGGLTPLVVVNSGAGKSRGERGSSAQLDPDRLTLGHYIRLRNDLDYRAKYGAVANGRLSPPVETAPEPYSWLQHGFAAGEGPAGLDAFDPSKQRTLRARQAATAAQLAVTGWTLDQDIPWLVLSGPYGVGKTHLLTGAVRAIAERGEWAAYLTGPAFDQRVKDFEASSSQLVTIDEWIRSLIDCPRLVIDDIGAGSHDRSGWVMTRWEALLDGRYRSRTRTLLSTNLGSEALAATVGERVYSRIFDASLSRVVNVEGDDMRPRL